jgi:hypothetical protein
VKASRSSSVALLTPGIAGLPEVEITSWPLGSSASASMSSLLESSPTSEPSKYRLRLPAVVAPSEVASKRMISKSSTAPRPAIVAAPSRENKIVSLSRK